MTYISKVYRSRFKYFIFVYILFPLLIISRPIKAQDSTQKSCLKDSSTIFKKASPYEKYIEAYNYLLKLALTTQVLKPENIKDASVSYLQSKLSFEKSKDSKDYQKQTAAYNRLTQLIVTKKITAPPELANAQENYFLAKRNYEQSLKNRTISTRNMPNVSNKKEIYKKYIETYKKLLDTMHGDMKGETKTPEQQKAFKEYQHWKKMYEKAIRTKNIK
ncbi:MAG TPA: hypothetical protein ENI76_09700 [Ignavibacteria bacterium]|nr:hypothetical protein [Ignavibacteria bacterium]